MQPLAFGLYERGCRRWALRLLCRSGALWQLPHEASRRMIKIIAGVRRRSGMTHAEYLRYIEDIHGGLAKANTMGLSRYVQNHVFDGAFGKAAYERWFHRDSITELYFAGFQELVATFTDPYTRDVVGPDGAKFADLATNLSLPPTTEQILQEPPRPGAAVKVMQFVKIAGEAASLAARWQDAHAAAIKAAPDFGDTLCGHVRSIAAPPPEAAPVGGSEYFGGGDMPQFDGVASFWLASEQDLPAFRDYEAALAEQGLFDRDLGFFVHAREVEIFDLGASG